MLTKFLTSKVCLEIHNQFFSLFDKADYGSKVYTLVTNIILTSPAREHFQSSQYKEHNIAFKLELNKLMKEAKYNFIDRNNLDI